MLKRGFSGFMLLILLSGLVFGPAKAASVPATSGPNIIVIMTDDQDLTMGSLNYMPKLRQYITEQGTTFANFFTPQSLCCPSRVTFLRGQYPHNHQVYTNLPPLGGFEKAYTLGLEQDTLATALHTAGYRTALIGKYLNGYPLSTNQTYIPAGWDVWFSPTTEGAYGSYNYMVNDNGTLVTYGSTRTDYITDVLRNEALDFIGHTSSPSSEQPFFLLLTFYAPHSPANPAQRHVNLFPNAQVPRTVGFNEGDMSDKPTFMQTRPNLIEAEIADLDLQYRRRVQSLQAVDEAIEALVLQLAANNQLDNTYIFFLSDNGYHLGQHRLPAGKASPYEEDIHVPLIVRGPGVRIGAERAELASMIDLAPTLTEIGHATTGYLCDGQSLLPLMTTPAIPSNWRKAIHIEYYHDAVQRQPDRVASWEPLEPMDLWDQAVTPQVLAYTALRTERYSFVDRPGLEDELYDLAHDPEQVRNRWRDAPATMKTQLASYLAALQTCSGVSCRMLAAQTPPVYDVPPWSYYLPLLQAR